MNIDNLKLIKKIGYGMYGTIYLVKYENDYRALKIEHILKKDMNKKSSIIWNEINFSLNFGNNYPDQFIKLHAYDFINNCEHNQEYSSNITIFSNKTQKKIKSLSSSDFCIRKIYSLIDTSLDKIFNKLSKVQIYSMLIQLFYTVNLLEKNNYIHGDIHAGNIGVLKTDIKTLTIGNYTIPTEGYIYKLIDYGFTTNKNDTENKKQFKKLFGKESKYIILLLINFPLWTFINKNNIKINDDKTIYKKIKKTSEFKLLEEFTSDNDLKFLLFQLLNPELYQKTVSDYKFKKVYKPVLRIDLLDIIFIIKSINNLDTIIKFLLYKINN